MLKDKPECETQTYRTYHVAMLTPLSPVPTIRWLSLDQAFVRLWGLEGRGRPRQSTTNIQMTSVSLSLANLTLLCSFADQMLDDKSA